MYHAILYLSPFLNAEPRSLRGSTAAVAPDDYATLLESQSAILYSILFPTSSTSIFTPSPPTVRSLLLVLLRIDRYLREAADREQLRVGTNTQHILESVVCARELNGLPSVRRAALEALALLKGGDLQSEVAQANGDIVPVSLQPHFTPEQGREWNGVEIFKESIREKGFIAKRDVEALLGYGIASKEGEKRDEPWEPTSGKVHMQRVGDILGPELGGLLDG